VGVTTQNKENDMSAAFSAKKSQLITPSKRPPPSPNRIGSLVQVYARTETDEDGNCREVRINVDRRDMVSLIRADEQPRCGEYDPSALRSHDIEDCLPDPKSPKKALTAAVTRSRKGLSNEGAALTWRKLGVKDGRLRFGLYRFSYDEGVDELGGQHLATVSAHDDDKECSPQVDLKNPRAPTLPISDMLERYHQERQLLHSDSVRSFVNRLLEKMCAVRIGGLLHFVEKGDDNYLRVAERALVLAGYSILIMPIDDGSHFAQNAQEGLMSQVAKLYQKVNTMKSEQDADKKVGPDTVERRLQEMKKLKERAESYSEILGMATEDIDSVLGDIQRITRATWDAI